MSFKSAIYTGTLHHQRNEPRFHDFRYEVVLFYLDLNELDQIFRVPFLFSNQFPRLFGFRRKDYLAGQANLDEAVRDRIFHEKGRRPTGPIRLLTQIRYFGFCFNPVSFYYCFTPDGRSLDFIVTEITNTPWNERRSYVLECKPGERRHRFEFNKDFHVSPFMPIELKYAWVFSEPDPHEGRTQLNVYMEDQTLDDSRRVFFANLVLEPIQMTHWNLTRKVLGYPFMTLKTVAAIYYQAMRLWLKKIPIYTHPEKRGRK